MIKAKKHLGQNWLTNRGVLEKIATCTQVEGRNIIEIGPGRGALTEYLIRQEPRSLHLIELDSDLLPGLEERFGKEKNVHIHHQDILRTYVGEEDGKFLVTTINPGLVTRDSGPEYTVFGNIPYYITSPILSHFLYDQERKPEKMVILMQREVAEKILKRDGKNSALSLMMDYGCTSIREVMKVSPGSFSPAPKVSSSVLLLEVNESRKPGEEKALFDLIKQGFRSPRKKVLNNLGPEYREKLEKIGLSPDVRPEEICIDKWIEMIK